MIDLKQGDCLELMKEIPDGSIPLIVMDPPYNMKKSKEWDSFKPDEYVEFMGKVFAEANRILKDNGQIYWFHNNIPLIAEIVHWIKENTGLVFSSFLIFPKLKSRRQSWGNPRDTNTLRTWFNACEYALLYINGKSTQTEWDVTGWERVKLDVKNFANLRKYSYNMLCYIGGGQTILPKADRTRSRTQTSRTLLLLPPRQKGGSLAKSEGKPITSHGGVRLSGISRRRTRMRNSYVATT